ncbi:ATPase, PP-loop superfamily protein [groundwater metagenome]|uniref:ATPase, PP-loop superfamily protein n=1 Tax=groundwater metagenome TaxID=717931 RepID=A0A098EAS2_9ZZZZ
MQCTKCKKEAVINLRYNGLNLCNACFVEYFEKRARATIRNFNMIDVGDKIAVGLSGGKDSSSLLYFLKNFSEKRRTEIIAMTIDIGINDEYGSSTLNNAKEMCQKLGIEHRIYSFKDETGMTIDEIHSKICNNKFGESDGLCTYCGVLRRDIMNKKAKELCCNKLAIAHNLEDEDQAFLMNIVRGDIERIIRGSGLIKDAKMIPRIKPFIKSPEDEVKFYAKINFPELNFEHICPYRKDAYRKTFKDILNLLNNKHPGSNFQIFESNNKLRNLLLKDYKIEGVRFCKTCGNLCIGEICKRCELLKRLNLIETV